MRNLWQRTLAAVSKEISPHSFDTWFASLTPKDLSSDILTIHAPDQFFCDWIAKHYQLLIERCLAEAAQHPVQLIVVVGPPMATQIADGRPTAQEPASRVRSQALSTSDFRQRGLSTAYTFQSFVVGGSNQFAQAACLAVAENPGQAYNPLFIYGGVGLGKTHLLHAIGNAALERSPNIRLSYVSSEVFVNDLISSLQHDRMNHFREKYRKMDILLIDDIQFLAGKDRTQEEFFHTFNTLYEARKQIVMSSDRYPKEISSIEERLRSRFEWGLIADIQPPELETKVAILMNKAEERSIRLPQEVAIFIASKMTSNIRELEGALIRISAFSSLTGAAITTELAQEAFQHLLLYKDRQVSIKNIQKAVAEHFNLSLGDLKSKKRPQSIARPRQIAMFLCRKYTNASLPEIGREFGGKDHSTVIHSCRKIDSLVETSGDLRNQIERICRDLDLV